MNKREHPFFLCPLKNIIISFPKIQRYGGNEME